MKSKASELLRKRIWYISTCPPPAGHQENPLMWQTEEDGGDSGVTTPRVVASISRGKTWFLENCRMSGARLISWVSFMFWKCVCNELSFFLVFFWIRSWERVSEFLDHFTGRKKHAYCITAKVGYSNWHSSRTRSSFLESILLVWSNPFCFLHTTQNFLQNNFFHLCTQQSRSKKRCASVYRTYLMKKQCTTPWNMQLEHPLCKRSLEHLTLCRFLFVSSCLSINLTVFFWQVWVFLLPEFSFYGFRSRRTVWLLAQKRSIRFKQSSAIVRQSSDHRLIIVK